MNQEQNEITLGQLFGVVKKSFKRALLYILIAVVLTTAILMTTRAFVSTNIFTSTITVSTLENEEPDETLLSKLNLSKSLVVSKAMAENNISVDLTSDIVANTTITAKIPETIPEDEVFVPTVFNITINKDKDLNLSNNQYQSLLDSISKEYVNIFSTTKLPKLTTLYEMSGLPDNVEYIEYLDGIYSNLVLAKNTTEAFIAKNNTIVELNIISQKVNAIIASLDALKLNIYDNTIEKNAGAVASNILVAQKNAQTEVSKYTTITTNAETAITAYQATLSQITNNTNGNIYYLDDAGFVKLYDEYIKYSNMLAEATAKSDTLNNLSPKTKGTMTAEQAKAQLNALSTAATAVFEEYDALQAELNNNQSATSIAKVTMPARILSENFISTKIIILANIAVILIAYVIAFSQTFSKLKNNGYFDNAEKEA